MIPASTGDGVAICVLGPSRSGTSLTARLLELAGVYLGEPADLLHGELPELPEHSRDVARRANPEGFWEHYRLMRLNERILRRLGGNWREPPPLPAGWEGSEELEPEREQARALLEQTFAGRPLWGWKDPRNALTLPFWRSLVPDLRCVVCLRDPVDAATSLRRRDGMSFECAVRLWRRYVAAGMANSAGSERLVVRYEDYFADPRGAAARLATFAGRRGAFERAAQERRLAEAIDERLWRNRSAAAGRTAAARGRRSLDFIVIGVQKGGTTSLWEYLRRHPRLALPDDKEWPVFCSAEPRLPGRLEWLMRTGFADAPAGALLGHVSTHYMMGLADADVETVAGRIARFLPRVRLLALLRDPVERAMSHYRMSVRRGLERRAFETVVDKLLEPRRLDEARLRPTETNSYLVQGEYGRILGVYRARFGAEQLHVEHTADLGRDPGAVLDRVLAFLGLPPGYRPEGLGERHHRGGFQPRIDAEGERRLRDFLECRVWPRLGEDAPAARRRFDFFLRTWNVVPDDRRPDLSAAARERLRDHYRADGEALAALGLAAPWVESW